MLLVSQWCFACLFVCYLFTMYAFNGVQVKLNLFYSNAFAHRFRFFLYNFSSVFFYLDSFPFLPNTFILRVAIFSTEAIKHSFIHSINVCVYLSWPQLYDDRCCCCCCFLFFSSFCFVFLGFFGLYLCSAQYNTVNQM